MESLKSTFNNFDVEIASMSLESANQIFPFVMSWMTEISMGNFKFFQDIKPVDVELFQKVLCENVYKFKEKEGRQVKTNLSYSDLSDCKKGFLPLLVEFLEFNFGFFSEARRIIEPFLRTKKQAE